MKRKLFSAMLGAFALLLLMGAASTPTQPAATRLRLKRNLATQNSPRRLWLPLELIPPRWPSRLLPRTRCSSTASPRPSR